MAATVQCLGPPDAICLAVSQIDKVYTVSEVSSAMAAGVNGPSGPLRGVTYAVLTSLDIDSSSAHLMARRWYETFHFRNTHRRIVSSLFVAEWLYSSQEGVGLIPDLSSLRQSARSRQNKCRAVGVLLYTHL